MAQMKTPGVYIVEKNAFPSSVVEVATAVPAFIGYTEIATNKGKKLINTPWRISSMSEFHEYFGGGFAHQFKIVDESDDDKDAAADMATNKPGENPAFSVAGTNYLIIQESTDYLLYRSMLLFFQNGGGPCYIVSVGNYTDSIEKDKLTGGIDKLLKEQEPTMVVIPETVRLTEADSISVQQAALAHCGEKMRNRITILDIFDGNKDRQDPAGDMVSNFRSALGINNLDFASAYYPWLNTTIVGVNDQNYRNITNRDILQAIVSNELGLSAAESEVPSDAEETPEQRARRIKKVERMAVIEDITNDFTDDPEADAKIAQLDKVLSALSPSYRKILVEMQNQLNQLPPAAAMAGVYTMVDNARGVWKAPANVSLSAVVSPTVNITHDEQEDLNVTIQGKSINAIRSFIGEGVLVWGARTLDGNSQDWRYVNVRRTMIMLEESIRLAAKAYVFEPNVANTWVTIRSMIRNFLTGIWKRGGLAGAIPEDAFSVHVGLGETMTPEDVLDGILRVTVLVAISRPAEFIEITFQQQMQKS